MFKRARSTQTETKRTVERANKQNDGERETKPLESLDVKTSEKEKCKTSIIIILSDVVDKAMVKVLPWQKVRQFSILQVIVYCFMFALLWHKFLTYFQ